MLIPSWLSNSRRSRRLRPRLRLESLECRTAPAVVASLVADIMPGPAPSVASNYPPVELNGAIYFQADDGIHGKELWRSDGTAAGTYMVMDINPGPDPGVVDPIFTVMNGILFFKASNGINGHELWRTDGTEAGTMMVADIRPGPNNAAIQPLLFNSPSQSYFPRSMFVFNDMLYFVPNDGVHGYELWRSDGIPGGVTELVADINPGSASSSISSATAVNGVLYFGADDGARGRELWRSDGTGAGTWLVKDINPGAAAGCPANLPSLSSVNGVLVFAGDDGVRGPEPWRSDGTDAGTTLLRDISTFQSTGTNPSGFTNITDHNGAETLIFWTTRWLGQVTYLIGLWKTDGTPTGTVEIRPFTARSAEMIALGGSVYFRSEAPKTGFELWKSDGTPAGTIMLTDNPGAASTDPTYLRPIDNRLYFKGYRGDSRYELWTSDGTVAGTGLLLDIVPGPDSSSAINFTGALGTIFFYAVDSEHGGELWRLDDVAAGPSISINDVSLVEAHAGTTSAEFTVTLSTPSTQTVTVEFLTANGTATAGSDYQSTGGTVIFAPGEVSKTISVPIIGDRLGEPNETFFVNLTNAVNGEVAVPRGIGTILDDEPRVAINDVALTEGNSGTKLFVFNVTLAGAYDQNVTVSFRTLNGTATSTGGQADFVAQTGTLTFLPGETLKTISIVVKGDTKKEANETFNVELFNLSNNAFFADNLGLGTILNDD